MKRHQSITSEDSSPIKTPKPATPARRRSEGGGRPSTPTAKVNTSNVLAQISSTYKQVLTNPFLRVFLNPDLRAILLNTYFQDTNDVISIWSSHPAFLSKKVLFFSRLSYINLSYHCTASDAWFEAFLKRCHPAITRLILCGCENLVGTLRAFNPSVISWNYVEELSLEGIRGFDMSFYWKLLPLLTNLRKLNLNSTSITLAALQKLPSPGQLQLLFIYRCNLLDTDIEILTKHFPNLNALMIGGGTSELRASSIQQLSALTRLRDLRLCQMSNVTEREIDLFSQRLNRLRSITLYHVPVKDSAIDKLWIFQNLESVSIWGTKVLYETTFILLVERAVKLKYLSVADCKCASPQLIQQLKKARPDLEIDMKM